MQAPKASGRAPERLLEERSSWRRVEQRSARGRGIWPWKWFEARYTNCSEPEGREGTGPENWLLEKFK